MIFETEQITIRRINIGTDQHRLARLNDFVVRPTRMRDRS